MFKDNSNWKKTSQPTTSPVPLLRGQYLRDQFFYKSRRWRSGRRGRGVTPCSNPNEQANLFQSSQAEKTQCASRAGPFIAAETEGGESGAGGADLQLGKVSQVRYRLSAHMLLWRLGCWQKYSAKFRLAALRLKGGHGLF